MGRLPTRPGGRLKPNDPRIGAAAGRPGSAPRTGRAVWERRSAASHQSLADGARSQLRPTLRVQLLEDVAEMELRGVLADPQASRDLLVSQPQRHELEHLDLAVGEAVRLGGGCRA